MGHFLKQYVALLLMLYANQMASVNGSSKFQVQRGVKQGDILSAILFNCVLDVVFDEWRRSLDTEGLYIALGVPRLTNIRYADDILLFAKSIEELVSMTEKLIEELKRIGLTLNAKKTKILRCNPDIDDYSLNVVEIGNEFVKVMKDKDMNASTSKIFSPTSRFWSRMQLIKDIK